MAARKTRGTQLSTIGTVLALTMAGCGLFTPPQHDASNSEQRTLTVYTSVTADTVEAVKHGYQNAHPDTTVRVFREPTGKLNARIAADQRSGGVRADVIWGTDPLSMHSYADQKLLTRWQLPDITGIPDQYKTDHFWGTRVLQLVLVAADDIQPRPWRFADLTDPAYRGQVALPDPAFAGSAFTAMGHLAQHNGMGFYRSLKALGATQVASVPQVVTDVAMGRYQLGITLARTARNAAHKGSPVQVVWPRPGAIALYSPIGIVREPTSAPAAKSFVRHVLSPQGQRTISETGWTPARQGIEPPFRPPAHSGRVFPDWSHLFSSQQQLLERYQAIF